MCVGVPRPVHKRPRSHRVPLLMTKSILPTTPSAPHRELQEGTTELAAAATVTKPVTPEPADARRTKKSVAFAPVESTVASYIPCRGDIDESERASVWYGPYELDAIKERARDAARRLRLRDLEKAQAEAEAALLSSGEEETSDGESEVLRMYRERCSVALRRSQLQHQAPQRRPASTNGGQPEEKSPFSNGDDDDNACPRGFELRLSPLRQRNRALAHKATLEFARRQKQQQRHGSQAPPAVDPSVHLALISSKLSRWSREIALSTGHGDFLDAYEVFKGVLPAPRTVEEISREHRFPLGVKRSAPSSSTGEGERRVRRRVHKA